MVILRYIFWVMALFLFGGCAGRQVALRYNWDLIASEASGGGANMIYATESSGFGLDIAGGVVLNQRSEIRSAASFPAETTVTHYQVRYADNYRPALRNGYRYPRWNQSTVSRRASYTIEGGQR